jgi:hypothetical protein
MNDSSATSRQHYLFALLLFMAGLLIILIFLTVRSQADDTQTDVGINNNAPSVDSVHISDVSTSSDISEIEVTDNDTVPSSTYVYGTWHDDNGCSQVTGDEVGIEVVLYAPDANINCEADIQNCYVAATTTAGNCTLAGCTGGVDTDGTYTCELVDADTFPFHATQGTWTAAVTMYDNQASTNTSEVAEDTITVNELMALTPEPGDDLNFGDQALGDTTGDKTLTIINTGNTTIDWYAYATRMDCTVGYIATSSLHYDLNTGTGFGAMTLATDSDSVPGGARINVDLGRRSTAVASTDDLSFKLQLPADGISGSCTGNVAILPGVAT